MVDEVENFDSKRIVCLGFLRKEVVLVANVDLWELWDKQRYDEIMKEDWEGFDQLAQMLWVILLMENSPYHIPVLLHVATDALITKENGLYIDLTFGGGGH